MDGVGRYWREVLEKVNLLPLIVKGCLCLGWMFFDVFFFLLSFFLFIFPQLLQPILVGYGMYVLPAFYHYIFSPQYSSWVTRAFVRRDTVLMLSFSIIL